MNNNDQNNAEENEKVEIERLGIIGEPISIGNRKSRNCSVARSTYNIDKLQLNSKGQNRRHEKRWKDTYVSAHRLKSFGKLSENHLKCVEDYIHKFQNYELFYNNAASNHLRKVIANINRDFTLKYGKKYINC